MMGGGTYEEEVLCRWRIWNGGLNGLFFRFGLYEMKFESTGIMIAKAGSQIRA